MRVANVIVEPRIGGPQMRIAAVADRLLARGIETIVYTSRGDSRAFAELLERRGIQHRAVRLRRFTLKNGIPRAALAVGTLGLQAAELAREFRKSRIDVVHVNGIANPQAAIAAWSLGLPVLWQMNDCMTPRWVSRPLARLAWRISTKIPVSVEACARYHFPTRTTEKEKFHLLYAPVDAERFSPSGRYAEIPDGRRVILSVGNPSPVKGTDVLVRAAAIVRQQVPEVLFWVVGQRMETQRAYWSDIDRMIRSKNLQSHFELLGRRDDIAELQRSAAVYVCSSRSEACPISVLEAMASETPCVATEVGGIPELIEGGIHGLLVPSEDPVMLARSIVDLLENEERARHLARAARERVLETFTLEQAVDRHEEMYRSAIG